MEDQPVRTGGFQTEWCCIILAILLLVFEYFTYGEFNIWTINMVIVIFFFIFLSIYSRFSIRRRVYSHMLYFSNQRIAIQKLMIDLRMGFYDIMFVLNDIQRKKKLPLEIDERTGEVVIGELGKKAKKLPVKKTKIIPKSIKPKAAVEKEVQTSMRYRCTNCGFEMDDQYKYCPGCGRPLKKLK